MRNRLESPKQSQSAVCPICRYPQATVPERCPECGAALHVTLSTDEQLEPYPIRSSVSMLLVALALLSSLIMASDALYQRSCVDVHDLQMVIFRTRYQYFIDSLNMWEARGGRTSGWRLPEPPSLSEALAEPVPDVSVRLVWRSVPVALIGVSMLLIGVRLVQILIYRHRPANRRARNSYHLVLLLVLLTGATGVVQLGLVVFL